MKMNMDALKALELKLAEYSEENGAIAEHESSHANAGCFDCTGRCSGCSGSCGGTCAGSCKGSRSGK